MSERRVALSAPAALSVRDVSKGQFRAAVPLGLDRRHVAIVALQSLRFGAKSKVLVQRAASEPAEYAITAAFGPVELGSEAQVGPLYSLGSTPVSVAKNATVHGYVKAVAGVRAAAGARISSGAIERAFPNLEDFHWDVRFPESTRPIVRRARDGERLDVAPGSYSRMELEANASLRLFSGHYYVDALVIPERATVHIDNTGGPVYLWVRRELELGGTLSEYYLQPNVLIGFAGTKPPKLTSTVRATLVAPNATVKLPATPDPHWGAVYARDVELEDGASIELHPFGAWIRSSDTQHTCEVSRTKARNKERECCNGFRRFATLGSDHAGACLASCSTGPTTAHDCPAHCRGLVGEDLRGAKTALDQCLQEVWFAYFDGLQREDLRPNTCPDLGFVTYTEGTCAL